VGRALLSVLAVLVLAAPVAGAHAAGPCKRGRLPDPRCSPGKPARGATVRAVCTPGYSRRVRQVSERTKRRVYRLYGIRHRTTGQYEVDHIIPLELGGSNSIRNLFPEAARPRPGFHEKDRLENRLHYQMCAGKITLRSAQRRIRTNWLLAYRREFEPVPLDNG
jgi:hypothetical protein